jgi:hypothetical protein
MFSVKLYEKSLGVRRATWVALGCLAFWRIGYEGLQRGFWEGGRWNWGHVVDPGSYNAHGLPTAEFAYVLKALAWSAVEIAGVIAGTVIAIEAFHWIKQGFVQKEDANQ